MDPGDERTVTSHNRGTDTVGGTSLALCRIPTAAKRHSPDDVCGVLWPTLFVCMRCSLRPLLLDSDGVLFRYLLSLATEIR